MVKIEKKFINVNFYDTNKPEYIVVHYTAGTTSKAGQAENTRLHFNNMSTKASCHFIVDDEKALQILPIEKGGWHAGNKKMNMNSIGIEMCSNIKTTKPYSKLTPEDPWYFTIETLRNTEELISDLMILYNIPIEKVIRHYDVTKKICPAPFVKDEKAWFNFKKRIIENVEKIKGAEKEIIYNKIEEIPECYKEAVVYLTKQGYLKGTDEGLELSVEMLRVLTVLYRTIRGSSK